ncbi:PaaI family thioesterase [Brevibacterium sp. UCMA 11754]|uniref:PaaI family thioesterase n=1 Tax=Brevibacterium sp. UCMA 11754 TaxID=2749198 RepID=UPI001F28D424|nr:PaaI family thioesterase [Brevibacterium sp. UCMA 11754]MCF2571742.1 PaaI family thioesterase [Brevibacterium sp. UCMA 11754]
MSESTDRAQTDDVSQAMKDKIAASFAAQGLMNSLGARLGDVDKGEVHIHLPMSPEVTQQHGFFHGGATSTIADSAGGYAALTMFDSESAVLTVEFKINLIAPAVGEELEAIGTVLKPGRTLTISRLEVFAHDGGKRKLVAAGQQTLIKAQA